MVQFHKFDLLISKTFIKSINKFVSISVRQKVLEQINDPSYNDVRNLAISISFDEVMKNLSEKNIMNVVVFI